MSVITTNINALKALNTLGKNDRTMFSTMEALSTGKRITSAVEDAAGVSMASKMTSQYRSLAQATRNINDSVSMLQVADGASASMSNMLQRLRELSVQASSGTNTTDDRSIIEAEFQSLLTGIDQIVDTTQWNGMSLLDGSSRAVTVQVGANSGQTLSLDLGNLAPDAFIAGIPGTATRYFLNSEVQSLTAIEIGGLVINNAALLAATDDVTLAAALNADSSFNERYLATSTAHVLTITEKFGYETSAPIAIRAYAANGADFAPTAATVQWHADGGIRALVSIHIGNVTVSSAALVNADNSYDFVNALNSDSGFSARYTATRVDPNRTLIAEKPATMTGAAITIRAVKGDGSGFTYAPTARPGSTGSQTVGAEESTAGLGSNLSGLTSSSSGIIDKFDKALRTVAIQRSTYGTAINRLEYTADNLTRLSQNTLQSRSRIEDADYAQETSVLARTQIIQQAGSAMLAHANLNPRDVLSLLE